MPKKNGSIYHKLEGPLVLSADASKDFPHEGQNRASVEGSSLPQLSQNNNLE